MAKQESLSLLVLGATGIIGTEVCIAASLAGYAVTAVSRRPWKSDGSVVEIEHVPLDVRDKQAVGEALDRRRFTAVIDLLSFGPEQLESSLGLFGDKCGQYVFVSSATIFDGGGGTEITELSPHVKTEWGYPQKKILAEERLKELAVGAPWTYTIVRPYITYCGKRVAFGAWESGNVLCRLEGGRPVVIGDEISEAMTTLTHSSDLARGVLALVGNPAAENEDFNVTHGESQTWLEVYQVAAQALEAPLQVASVRVDDIAMAFPQLSGKISDRLQSRVFRNDKFMQACPGFQFEYSLESGYRQALVEWFAHEKCLKSSVMDGAIDRLIHARSHPRPPRLNELRYAGQLLRHSPGIAARYLLGYFPALCRIVEIGRRGITRQSPQSSDYE